MQEKDATPRGNATLEWISGPDYISGQARMYSDQRLIGYSWIMLQDHVQDCRYEISLEASALFRLQRSPARHALKDAEQT